MNVTSRVFVVLSLSCVASFACSAGSSSQSSGGEPPSADERAPAPAEQGGDSGPAEGDVLSAELRAKVCSAEHVDGSSDIARARDSTGAVTRIIVTPSREIADMGNLIFDMQGEFLGHDTGGEFPWDDNEAMATERERVAGLMGGAEILESEKATPCKSD